MTEITTTALGTTTNALVFQSTTFDVIDQNGQPWLRAPQIAQALGYSDASSINRIYARRSKEFTDNMTGTVKLTDPNGDLQETRIFSLRGSHLLGMFARTEIAAQFRNWILDILEGKAKQPALLPQTITNAQAQHLRELVQLVVESGKQSHGETWNRLHRKMKVTSYKLLHPSKFDDAVEYLRGKMDDTSIAAIAAKHFPQLAAPAPQQAIQAPAVTPTQVADMVDHRALLAMSYSIQLRLFEIASNNQDRGPGYDMASKIKDLSPADLYVVNVAASQEVWLRTLQRKQA